MFSTKNRKPLIADEWEEEMYAYIGGIIRGEGGIQLEIGGVSDHVHILAKFKPAISVATMMSKIKANSSKWINEVKVTPRTFAWQTGYSAFTVSESQAPPISHYIRNQKEHHRRQSFEEELVALLERHGVKYDPRYLFDDE